MNKLIIGLFLTMSLGLQAEIPDELKDSYNLLYGNHAEEKYTDHCNARDSIRTIIVTDMRNLNTNSEVTDEGRYSIMEAGLKIITHFSQELHQ